MDYNLIMSWHVNTFAFLLQLAGAALAESGPVYLEALSTHKIYKHPRPGAFRGIVPYGGVVEVLGDPVPGRGCDAGWVEIAGHGYMCSERTRAVPDVPAGVEP